MPVKYLLFITLQMHHIQESTSKTTVPSGQSSAVKQIMLGMETEDRGT